MSVKSVKFAGQVVTRAAVDAAIAECDSMGQEAFLAYYGFGQSRRYWLRGERTHRPYPSKAILCVAAGKTKRHGVHNQRVFGGVAATVRALTALGFVVREGNQPVKSAGMDSYRASVLEAGFSDPSPDWDKLTVTPSAVFASGANTVGNIRGFAAARFDVGVAAPHVSAKAERELLALAGTDVAAFIDSGAFSEVTFRTPCQVAKKGEHRFPNNRAFCADCGKHRDEVASGPRVIKPITEAKWKLVLALYSRLAAKLGGNAWVVAPDQVGSQEVTLERLARYRTELAELDKLGATILVVAQKGALSQSDFYAKALEAAGLTHSPNVVAALPCKKAATSAAEVAAFVREAKVPHVHLLGKGPRAADIMAYTEVFGDADVTTSYSLDSCWITANVGRKTKVRRYTWAQDLAEKVLFSAGRISKLGSRLAADVALKLELALLVCLGAPLPSLSLPGQQLSLWAA